MATNPALRDDIFVGRGVNPGNLGSLILMNAVGMILLIRTNSKSWPYQKTTNPV